jgi:signal transduction histidine kinase
VKKLLTPVSRFISRYPAILAAYFIYGYYFISTMDFYIAFKHGQLDVKGSMSFFAIVVAVASHFDTVLWMWLLSWVLIWVIELRDKLHQHEIENLEHQKTILLRETQLRTMHEVVMTLKHQINNPLAIILGYIRLTQKATSDTDIIKKLSEIEIAAQRINTTMKELTLSKIYETTESPVGNLVQVSDTPPPVVPDKNS